MSGAWDNADGLKGSTSDGIAWNGNMSRLVIFISNPTDRDYDDLDFAIITSEAIATIKETSSIPCEQISGTQVSITGNWQPLLQLAPQRFRCDKLPNGESIKFVAALLNAADLEQMMAGHFPKPGTTYPHGLFWPEEKPRVVKFVAQYDVTFRPHQQIVNVSISGN